MFLCSFFASLTKYRYLGCGAQIDVLQDLLGQLLGLKHAQKYFLVQYQMRCAVCSFEARVFAERVQFDQNPAALQND